MATGIDIAEFRKNLPSWLERVRVGEEVVVMDRGAVIARVVPPTDTRAEARRELMELRARARVGDVETPMGEAWDAADDRP
jgi:antitoxin (DNA-binding transcriptional repressor) of toxin-antitoxin stability system